MRFAADENFNNNIIRGLLLRNPKIDVVRIQDVGLSGRDDSVLLEWAFQEKRIFLTHDAETVPYFAYERVKAGIPIPAIFIVNQDVPIRHINRRVIADQYLQQRR